MFECCIDRLYINRVLFPVQQQGKTEFTRSIDLFLNRKIVQCATKWQSCIVNTGLTRYLTSKNKFIAILLAPIIEVLDNQLIGVSFNSLSGLPHKFN